jgi:DNA repair protein RadC
MDINYKVAEVKLSYKSTLKYKERVKVSSAEDAYKLLLPLFDEDTIEYNEFFKVLLLDNANHVLGYTLVSQGGLTETCVDIRIILQAALLCNATNLILAHNHPSGNLTPSEEDLSLTNKIKEAAKLMRINVMDHLILTSESYFSFADDGLM